AAQQNRDRAKRPRWPRRNEVNSQVRTHLFKIGLDKQRLARSQNVFRQAIGDLARSLGKNAAVLAFQLEADLFFLLEGDIESTGVENLAQLGLHRTQHLIRIEMRADGLPDFGEHLVFLGPALRVVHDDIVFQRQRDLQRQADEQPQIRRSEHAALGMGEQNDSEVVLARLQAHRHHVADSLGKQSLLKGLELSSRERRQRFFEIRQIAERDHATAPIGEFGGVIAGFRFLKLVEELGGETLLHRRNRAAPLRGNKDYGAARRERGHQTIYKRLQAGSQIVGRKQLAWVGAEGRKGKRIFLHRIALVFKQHH